GGPWPQAVAPLMPLDSVTLPGLLPLLLLPCLATSDLCFPLASWRSHVHRRGLLELAGTMNCVGTRNPLSYIGYGCYCGLGGHGQPRDAIDWCCHRHDCCYTRAEQAGCSPKMERYSWQCVNQSIASHPAWSPKWGLNSLS
uniref:Phospholipase A2 n=1 Tax=Panthera tigris altaica TaxID=74533 RepID=A0A8C9JBR4_PANTA